MSLDTLRRPQNVEEWRSAVLRSGQHNGSATASEQSGRSEDGVSVAGRPVNLLWLALGILVFFIFVEGADMLRQHAEKERVAALQTSTAAPLDPSGAGIGTQFQHADTDASGGLSREEVTARLPQLAGKFDEIDANRDGRITIQELQSYWQRQPAPQPAAAEPQRDR